MRIKSFNISFGSQFFKALSDESRLRILHLLSRNEKMCISDIEMILDFTQTKTSRHITYLKNSNMVTLTKVDQYAFYSINPRVTDFIENIFSYLNTDSILKEDLKNYKIMYSNRELKAAQLEFKKKNLMKEYTHIFFDLDHTLWDFDKNSTETLNKLYTDFGIDKRSNKTFDFYMQKYKFYNRKLWEDYELGRIDKDELRTQRFYKSLLAIGVDDLKLSYDLGDLYVKESPYKTALVPFALEILNYLSDKKYNLHIITNGFEEVQHIKLKNCELDIFFQHTITSEQANAKKPSIGIFQHAFKLTGATVRNSVIIGDSYHSDIVGGMNIGMDTVYYNPENFSYNKKPTHDINCLSELYKIL